MNSISTSRRVLIVAAALAVVATACASSGEAGTTTTRPAEPSTAVATVTTTSTTATTTTIPDTSTTTETTTTTLATSTVATEPSPTTTTLPGEPFEMGFPNEGDVLGVIGVWFDDVLKVRSGPGAIFTIVATLDPLGEVVATGRARLLPQSIWWEVTVGGTTGWASASFLAYLGGTDDATSEIVAGLGGVAETELMVALGRLVAEFYASDDPPSDIVMSVGPTVGDVGEVTFDVVGIGDDALRGFRLHVFGQPTEGGEGFSLAAVERTVLCGRGLAGELCV